MATVKMYKKAIHEGETFIRTGYADKSQVKAMVKLGWSETEEAAEKKTVAKTVAKTAAK